MTKRKQPQDYKDKKQQQVVNEYLDVLQASWGLVEEQEALIKKAIELRMYISVIQELLESINASGTLTTTIEHLCKIQRDFDVLAIENGPYEKTAYINAVLQPFLGGDNNAKDG